MCRREVGPACRWSGEQIRSASRSDPRAGRVGVLPESACRSMSAMQVAPWWVDVSVVTDRTRFSLRQVGRRLAATTSACSCRAPPRSALLRLRCLHLHRLHLHRLPALPRPCAARLAHGCNARLGRRCRRCARRRCCHVSSRAALNVRPAGVGDWVARRVTARRGRLPHDCPPGGGPRLTPSLPRRFTPRHLHFANGTRFLRCSQTAVTAVRPTITSGINP